MLPFILQVFCRLRRVKLRVGKTLQDRWVRVLFKPSLLMPVVHSNFFAWFFLECKKALGVKNTARFQAKALSSEQKTQALPALSMVSFPSLRFTLAPSRTRIQDSFR